jgi:hypothetical protein
MKVIKWILIVLVVIIGVPLIIAAFAKKEYKVEREVVINKPKAEVFEYVKYLKNQDNYSKWAKMDLNMRKTYKGTDGTVVFVSAWDSDNKDVGKGEQEIKGIKDGERIDYELRFIEPFASTSNAVMTLETVNPVQTKVKWGFNGNMAYPLNFMMVVMDIEKAVGDDLQTGLNNLKGILEK